MTHDERPTSSARRDGPQGRRRGRLCALWVAAVMSAGVASAWSCGPASAQVVEDAPVHRITVTLNKSKTLTFRAPFSTAVIGSPEIADLLPMTDHTLYVQGKKVGTTNISVFSADKRLVAVVDLEVALDAAALHGKIAASTGSGNIAVSSANGQVVLSGEASDAVAAARAVDVAKSLAPKDGGDVINAMRVAPTQQVMLKVRFLEVDRTAGRQLGVNWFGGNKYGAGYTGLGSVTGAPSNVAPPINPAGVFPGAAATLTPFGSLLAQVININGLRVDALISALEDKGLVKTLAEPDLIAQSGEKASFFAGSQIPIPTVQPGTVGTTPTVTTTYYPCGVTLNFVPTVLNTGLVNVHLGPQVCQVATTSNPVLVNGTTIPELNTRSADTTVELRDGQSFAVAGLLQAQDVNELSQLPWMGNVPVLGALFRSTNYQKSETDLVVIVTVHLVRPVPPKQHLVTPFDTTLSANDIDLFLMGDTERKKKYTDFVTGGGGVQGPYGHILEAK